MKARLYPVFSHPWQVALAAFFLSLTRTSPALIGVRVSLLLCARPQLGCKLPQDTAWSVSSMAVFPSPPIVTCMDRVTDSLTHSCRGNA